MASVTAFQGDHTELATPPAPGRLARKRALTRARLLEAAYEVMSETGVDVATIKDITDRADVGFGTFYNYFESKDELAAQILDCVIDDLGRRNQVATHAIRDDNPLYVIPISTRLVIRDATSNPVWGWWATRTDLLVDRVREGLLPFASADIAEGIDKGLLSLGHDQIAAAWSLAVWLMVGGIHDIQSGLRTPDSDRFVVAAIMRILGVDNQKAEEITATTLPTYPPPSINWNFQLKRLSSPSSD